MRREGSRGWYCLNDGGEGAVKAQDKTSATMILPLENQGLIDREIKVATF